MGPYSCEFAKYISIYNDENPNITLNIIEHNHDNIDNENHEDNEENHYHEIYERFRTGEIQADLIIMSTSSIASFLNDGIIADLSLFESVKPHIDNPNIFDEVIRLCMYDDRIAGIPLNIFYSGLAINEELFAKVETAPPTAGWSYDDYYELALIVNEYNKTAATRVYMLLPSRTAENYAAVTRGFDLKNNYKPLFNTAEFVDYLRKAKAVDDMGLYYYPDHIAFSSFEDAINAKYGDNLLFHEIIYADLHNYSSVKFIDKNIIPAPTIMGQQPYADAVLLCLSANPINSKIAESFIAGFLSEEYQYKNAFEMQIYRDVNKYDILSTYSPQTIEWIRTVTETYCALILPLDVWDWINSIALPQGKADTINFEQFTEDLQAGALMYLD